MNSRSCWPRRTWMHGIAVLVAASNVTCLRAETPGYDCQSDLGGGFACRKPGACGNGAPDPGEDCDDGNQMSGDGCAATCQDRDAPVVDILFPVASSLSRSATLTVRGQVTDASGVTALRVNGIAAELVQADGVAAQRWQATLALASGTQEIVVDSEDALGNRDPRASAITMTVDRGPTLRSATGMILDPDRNRVLLIDRDLDAVVAVDLDTGARVLASDPIGTGPALIEPHALALDADRGRVLVADAGHEALVSVDLETGDRALLGAGAVGPVLDEPVALVLDADRGRVLVADAGSDALVAVELGSGARSLWIDGITGLCGLVLDPGRDRVLVAAASDPFAPVGLATIELETAAIAPFDSTYQGLLPAGGAPLGLAVDPAHDRLLVPLDTAVMAIDLDTGVGSVFSSSDAGTGPALIEPNSMVLDGAGRRLLVADAKLEAVVAIELTTRNRSLFSDQAVGSGPPLSRILDTTLDRARNRLLVAAAGLSSVAAIDLATGERSILSGPSVGSGPGFGFPIALDLDPGHERLLMLDVESETVGRIFAVHPDTGERSILCPLMAEPDNVGTDPACPPRYFGDLAMDAARDRMLVTLNTLLFGLQFDRVETLDLRSCTRSILTERVSFTNYCHFDPPFMTPDPDQDRVLMTYTDPNEGGQRPVGAVVVAMDLDSNARSLISSQLVGTGPVLERPSAIAMEPARGRALVVDSGLVIAVDLTTGRRTVLSDGLIGAMSISPYVEGELALIVAHDSDPGRARLLLVDLVTGEHVILSR